VFNLVSKRYWFFALSLLVIIPGLVALIIWHLNLGIDFTGGSVIQLQFASNAVTANNVQQAFAAAHPRDLSVITAQNADNTHVPGDTVWIRFNTVINDTTLNTVRQDLQAVGAYNQLSFDQSAPFNGKNASVLAVQFSKAPSLSAVRQALAKVPAQASSAGTQSTTASTGSSKTTTSGSKTTSASSTATTASTPVSVVDVARGQSGQVFDIQTQTLLSPGQITAIEHNLQSRYGYVSEISKQTVGPSIAGSTTLRAFYAVLLAAVVILLYIWWAFRKVSKPWRYGTCAIIALLHDTLVVLGLYAIFGKFFNMQVDTLFVTALLTVIGFSVHDTIVVFDRIRENMQKRTAESFETIVNASLVQTLARSLNTSLTVLLTLSALTLFGGVSIRTFTLTLLIGIFSGTYSSIFNASMLLVIWENGELGRLFGRGKRQQVAQARPSRALAQARS
jgi:preprotein translocase SecF subunit